MRKSHLFLAAFTSIALVGGIGSRTLLQPLPPPSIPNGGSSLPNPEQNEKPPLPSEGLSLPSQESVLNLAANLVIEKYQSASCEELAQMKPSSDKSSESDEGPQAAIAAQAMEMLRQNPEIREEFLNRVAPPIANKMFDCNVIP